MCGVAIVSLKHAHTTWNYFFGEGGLWILWLGFTFTQKNRVYLQICKVIILRERFGELLTFFSKFLLHISIEIRILNRRGSATCWVQQSGVQLTKHSRYSSKQKVQKYGTHPIVITVKRGGAAGLKQFCEERNGVQQSTLNCSTAQLPGSDQCWLINNERRASAWQDDVANDLLLTNFYTEL